MLHFTIIQRIKSLRPKFVGTNRHPMEFIGNLNCVSTFYLFGNLNLCT